MRRRLAAPLFLAGASLVLAASVASAPAVAQIPDKFTNLQVLPKDISKDELVATMRGFASGLGVRCTHCHVGGTATDLTGMKFESDDKKEKKIARAMMAMVKEINGPLLEKTGIESPAQVKCVTCHHGVTRPESLADVLKRGFERGGADSAKADYLALKTKYYGAAAYDFKPRTLNEVAEWLANERKDPDAAIAIMRFNIEQDPSVAYSHNLLGRIQAGKGDKPAAIASLKKAIELDPNDKQAARLLEKLQASPGVRYVYLIRHGMYDRVDSLDDRAANGLNRLGREQARLLGKRLAGLPVTPRLLASSDLRRARETASEIGAILSMTPGQDSLLAECVPPSSRPGFDLEHDSTEMALCRTNLEAAWAKYFGASPDRDAHDLLVCHGNVIRWFVNRALANDVRHWTSLDLANASLTVVAVRPDGTTRLVMYGDVGHLPVAKQTWLGRGAGWGKPAR